MTMKRYIYAFIFFTTCPLFALTDQEAALYCALHKNTYVVTLWPNVAALNAIGLIEQKIATVSKILHKKHLYFKKNGPFLFVTKVYAKEQERTGNAADNYRLARSKETVSFVHGTVVRVYLVQTDNLQALLKCKRNMREQFKLDFLHIPDTHQEAVDLAHFVFSDNVVSSLNAGRIA